MKKLLAICSIFLTVCATFTGCGDGDPAYGSNDRSSAVEEDERDLKDHAKDAADGVGDAGKDIVEGVTDAVDDVLDGLDGRREDERSTSATSRRSKR